VIDALICWIRDRVPMIPVGPADDPLLCRFFVIPRNRFFNIYLHCFHRSDEGYLHDHRMASLTVILQGWYYEERFVSRPVAGQPLPAITAAKVRRLRFRLSRTPHRVLLEPNVTIWSLFIGLPHVREWGFWVERDGAACWVSHSEL
jgi:hypothetical protein